MSGYVRHTDHIPCRPKLLQLGITLKKRKLEDRISIDEFPAHGPPLGPLSSVNKANSGVTSGLYWARLAGVNRLDQATNATAGKCQNPRKDRPAMTQSVC